MDNQEVANWKIITDRNARYIRTIISNIVDNIPIEAYNYQRYTPVVLAPINRSSTLVLSEFDDDGSVGLKIHDLRIVDDQVVSSITFNLRGSQYHLAKLKNELNRVCDKSRCVGVSYFLRKIYYTGFSTLYVPKILKPKVNGSLSTIKSIVKTTMIQEDCDER